MKSLMAFVGALFFLAIWALCLGISVFAVRYLAGYNALANPILVCLIVWLSTWITEKISGEIVVSLGAER